MRLLRLAASLFLFTSGVHTLPSSFASAFLVTAMKQFLRVGAHLVFWSWNLLFLGLMYIWLLPQIGFDLWRETSAGLVEPTFIASFLILMVIPLACTILGFVRLRKYPTLLMRLFYGVEAPLFTLCLVRLFVLRELTLASGFTLGLVLSAIAMFAIELLTGYAAYRPALAKLQMATHSLMLLVGAFLGAILTMYTLPTLVLGFFAILIGFFQFKWVSALAEGIASSFQYLSPGEAVLSLLFGTLALGSFAIFLSMPYAFSLLYMAAWNRLRIAFSKQYGTAKAWQITGITLTVSLILFAGLQVQPQIKAFNLLDATTVVEGSAARVAPLISYQLPTDTETRKAQLAKADVIKTGLTHAYLHRYRYLSPWRDSNALRNLYQKDLQLPEGSAQFFQNIHNFLLSPFLYRGADGDAERAADLYAQFFDVSIQEDQRAPIQTALQATANREDTSAGLLNLNQEIIALTQQEVQVSEQGDWATVEIHERYENDTPEDQEIFYSFSLPESAVLTGLWLGDINNVKQYPFVVSPRGAAQQVYKGEVARGQIQTPVDPALLEQVGPRQYRLRIYPIPRAERSVQEDPNPILGTTNGTLDLWMTYQVMQEKGQWPLPQLTEKRSIFWTAETERLRNGKAVEVAADQWFEPAIPAQKKAKAVTHQVVLPEGYTVTATPATSQPSAALSNKQIAVVVDSSYSMAQQKTAILQAVDQLENVRQQNKVDFYVAVAGADAIKRDRLSPQDILFYGSLQPADILNQFDSARQDTAYDAILLLTDEGSYELSKDAKILDLQAPLWIVHQGGALPSAYDDQLLQTLTATKGGVTTSVDDALLQIAAADEGRMVSDGYEWTVTAADGTFAQEKSNQKQDGFEAIAARQAIVQQSRTLDLSQVEGLDKVHAIAKRTGIVSPYSSMLVLVDDRQKELLKEAEAGADRFERETEDGQDGLANPNNPLEAASIPEPGQVLGLLVCAIALITLKRKSLVPE